MKKNKQEKEIKKLRRADLVDVILQLQKNEAALLKANGDLKERLDSKEIKIEKSGSIAEAAVAVSDLFIHAQDAADLYVSEIEKRCDEKLALAEKTLQDAQAKAEKIIADAEREAKTIIRIAEQTKSTKIELNSSAVIEEK